MASSDPQGEVKASTRNSPGAPAGFPCRTTDGTGNRTRQWPSPHTPTTAVHAARDRRRRDPPGTTPSRGPERARRGASPAPPPRRGPAAGTMSPVLGWPPRAPRSHPVKPGAQAPGVGKGTGASGKPTGAPRSTGPDEARRTTQGHEARQGGRPPATTKAHGQVPGNNGRQVPQTQKARTTRNEPRHRNRCQATPAAVQMDECAPGGYPAPTGYEKPLSRWTSARPEGTQGLPATDSRRPDGRVRARRVPSPCRLRTAAVWMDK